MSARSGSCTEQSRDTLQFTLDDPETFTKPVMISLTVNYVPDTEMLEYVCNENEKRLRSTCRFFPGGFPVDFVTDDKGAITNFLLHAPCGDFKFVRTETAPK